MSTTDEKAFESAIVASLTAHGGYAQGQSADYNPELGLFKNEVLAFLHSTQPRSWARIAAIHGDAAADKGFIVCVKKWILEALSTFSATASPTTA